MILPIGVHVLAKNDHQIEDSSWRLPKKSGGGESIMPPTGGDTCNRTY